MRVIIASTNYAPEATGTGKVNGELGPWLASHGHNVDVITAPPYYPHWDVQAPYSARRFETEMLDGVRVHRVPIALPRNGRVGTKARLKFEASFALSSLVPWIRLLLRRRRADVVMCVCPPVQVGLVGLVYSRLRRTPWIFHVQDLQVDVALELGMLKPSRAVRAMARLESYLLRKASLVTTISEPMRQRIIAKGVPADRVQVHRNWANLDAVTPGEPDGATREMLGASADQVLVMHAGNIGEKQGLDLLLDAADATRDDARIRYAVVGDGAARERLQDGARERQLANVTFVGVQPFERLPDILRAADIHVIVQRDDAADLVMPSRLGNVLAAARPSVATARPGTALHEVVDGADAGRCVDPGDAPAFTAAIRELAADSKLRARYGANGRAWAEEHLDQDRILERFTAALAAL